VIQLIYLKKTEEGESLEGNERRQRRGKTNDPSRDIGVVRTGGWADQLR